MFINDLFEAQGKKILVVYPGRFQPFHRGHASVFNYLVKQYGLESVFICTSDKVEPPRSPFSFQDKRKMIALTGIDPSKVIQSTQPYQAKELVSHYDPESTILLFAISEKDMAEDPRFKFTPKKDGSPSYFQPFSHLNHCLPLSKHGYMMTVPTITFNVLGKPASSATQIRAQFASADEQTQKKIVQDLFGNYNEEVFQIMRAKLATTNEGKQMFINQIFEAAARVRTFNNKKTGVKEYEVLNYEGVTVKKFTDKAAADRYLIANRSSLNEWAFNDKKKSLDLRELTPQDRNLIRKFFKNSNVDIKRGEAYVLPHNAMGMHGRTIFRFFNQGGQLMAGIEHYRSADEAGEFSRSPLVHTEHPIKGPWDLEALMKKYGGSLTEWGFNDKKPVTPPSDFSSSKPSQSHPFKDKMDALAFAKKNGLRPTNVKQDRAGGWVVIKTTTTNEAGKHGLAKYVEIISGPGKGKKGYVGEIRHGMYQGGEKQYTIDIDGGGNVRCKASQLRLAKDERLEEGYWDEAMKKFEKDNEARKGKTFEKNPLSHDKDGVYVGDKDLDGKPIKEMEGSDVEWLRKNLAALEQKRRSLIGTDTSRINALIMKHKKALRDALQQSEGAITEKSTSTKQARFMAAAAHNPKFAKKVGMDQSVAKEFNQKDKGTKLLSKAMSEEQIDELHPDTLKSYRRKTLAKVVPTITSHPSGHGLPIAAKMTRNAALAKKKIEKQTGQVAEAGKKGMSKHAKEMAKQKADYERKQAQLDHDKGYTYNYGNAKVTVPSKAEKEARNKVAEMMDYARNGEMKAVTECIKGLKPYLCEEVMEKIEIAIRTAKRNMV